MRGARISGRCPGEHRAGRGRTLGPALVVALASLVGPAGPNGSFGAASLAGQDGPGVTGIGGFFFRAADPSALAAWYDEHLGIPPVPTSYDAEPWRQDAGPTVFAPFSASTEYFGRPEQQWMINLRVRDLDGLVERLRTAGIEVEVDPETYPNGRFARLVDPEGNPIQLWEPERS